MSQKTPVDPQSSLILRHDERKLVSSQYTLRAPCPKALLSSWKEIAAYLGKGVRTVQRWEQELALPVRRPRTHKTGIVIANRAELDAWLKQQTLPRTPLADAAVFRYHILVADDDEGILSVSQEALSRAGYEVRIATDGLQALALMRKALPDLIISDLKMPNISGFEFLSVVRRRFPQIPVIAITCKFVITSQLRALPADKLFHKGEYSPEELFAEIQSLLERSPIRPHIPKAASDSGLVTAKWRLPRANLP